MQNPQSPLEILKTVFGYDSFRGEQAEIIDHILSGQSACVLMPTGAGKSLCYQIPGLCRPGLALVVSPLIALMQDQVSALKELGVRAAMLHSGLDPRALDEVWLAVREGRLDFLYIAPERLMTESTLRQLDQIRLSLLAIDEAHCVSQWGHDFRPEYRALNVLRRRYPSVPLLAVTATADELTRRDIMAQLQLERLFVAGFDRPNIHYEVGVKDNPRRQLLNFLQARQKNYGDGESGIIYCLSRKKAEETAAWLTEQGYKALPYHAGLDAGTRRYNQDRFIKDEGVIIVATVAFGMGINKPDVRFVAHLDLPSNIEAYYQETGRAGRDGLPSSAWMLYGMQDVALRRQMIENSNSPPEQKRLERNKLGAFLGYCEAAHCRRQNLLQYFGDASAPCGNCDICLAPPETVDGTVAAQKILSCIYRTGQLFGARHIIDVLLARSNPNVEKHHHNKLSTWGIGAEFDRKTWESFMRQLVAANLVSVDMEAHGGLKITAGGRAFLNEKNPLNLRLPGRITGRNERAKAPLDNVLESAADRELFDKLKAVRLKLARTQNLPPYVIFHDKTLVAMVLNKPADRTAIGRIPGVGQSKLDRYATSFLEAIHAAS